MRAVVADFLLRTAYGIGRPLPQGFMPLRAFDREWPVRCVVDPHMPDIGVFSMDVYGDGRVTVFGSPAAWATQGARNLAAAYRPEPP